jgi:hypothetical protein
MTDVIVVIGQGQIGRVIARRVGGGKQVLADLRPDNADSAAEVLSDAGYEVSVATSDAPPATPFTRSSRGHPDLGQLTGLIHAAGVSPPQASPATVLHVDRYGAAPVLEEFGNVIAPGGSGSVIASQSGHRLPPLTTEQNRPGPHACERHVSRFCEPLLPPIRRARRSRRGCSLRRRERVAGRDQDAGARTGAADRRRAGARSNGVTHPLEIALYAAQVVTQGRTRAHDEVQAYPEAPDPARRHPGRRSCRSASR